MIRLALLFPFLPRVPGESGKSMDLLAEAIFGVISLFCPAVASSPPTASELVTGPPDSALSSGGTCSSIRTFSAARDGPAASLLGIGASA